MRDLYVALVYLVLLGFGAAAPFVFALGYLWVDTFYPQTISSTLSLIPVAQVMGICAVGGYFLLDRKSPPRFSHHALLTLLFAGWVTLTCTWAEVPGAAWWKWDWAFKTILFAGALPLLFRSRVQIEAFLQVFLFSAAANVLPFGIKTILSGGGYGKNLGLLGVNIGLGESSYLATVSIALIPIILYLRRHSILLPRIKLRYWAYTVMLGIGIACAIGTFARTALIGFAVVAAGLWTRSRSKLVFLIVLGAVGVGGFLLTSDAWNQRISTITSFSHEDSAEGRLLVWQWTLDFAASHPLGGGFEAYRVNTIKFAPAAGELEPTIEHGKAFHSIYFEVLGEHGYPGLALYLALFLTSLLYLRGILRRTKGRPELAWCHDLAGTLMTAELTVLACGAFIGIAFQPLVWYLMALPVCLREHVRRVDLAIAAAPAPSRAGEALLAGSASLAR